MRVGMEATGHCRWFERLLGELNYELWVGDAAQIRAKQVRKQKNDRRDAAHLLKLMLEDNFPRIWVPTPENRDLRQLILHRHRLVGMRTRVMNQLQAIAMNEGVRRKKGLWNKKGRQGRSEQIRDLLVQVRLDLVADGHNDRGDDDAAEEIAEQPPSPSAPKQAWIDFAENNNGGFPEVPLPLGDPSGTFTGVPKEEVKKMLSDNFLSPDNVVLEQNSPIVNTGFREYLGS